MDANGNQISIRYKQRQLPEQAEDGAGNLFTLAFEDHRAYPRLRSISVQSEAADEAQLLVQYGYDDAGNLSQVSNGAGDITRQFVYRNHVMVEHSQPGGLVSRYEYDDYTASGRVTRNWTNSGQSWNLCYLPQETIVTDNLGREEQPPVCEARGEWARTYVYEPGSFVPLAQLDTLTGQDAATECKVHYIHTDHLGTPNEVTDQDGELTWAVAYKAWGNVLRRVDSAAHAAASSSVDADLSHVALAQAQPIHFQGQYHDSETGLHYNRFRYYDADCGRFVSLDPIALSGGHNTYQYAPNPVSWIDPFGLSAERCNCKVYWHDNRYRDNIYGHYSVAVTVDGKTILSHQRGGTGTAKMPSTNMGGIPPAAKVAEFNLPNPKAAQAFQEANIDKLGPAYDVKTQSCVTYVCDVLREGGLNISKEAGGQIKYLMRNGLWNHGTNAL